MNLVRSEASCRLAMLRYPLQLLTGHIVDIVMQGARLCAWPGCTMSVMSPSGPIMQRVDVTTFSRSGSSGGLVTCPATSAADVRHAPSPIGVRHRLQGDTQLQTGVHREVQ